MNFKYTQQRLCKIPKTEITGSFEILENVYHKWRHNMPKDIKTIKELFRSLQKQAQIWN
jgi:hypothetical protein